MTRARLHVTLPDGPWKGDVSRRHPDAVLRVHASVLDGDDGIELVTVSGPAADCVAAIEAHPDVTAVTTLEASDDEATVQVESATSALATAAREVGLPIEHPTDVRDGEATVEVTGSHARLSAFGDRLRERDHRFDVDHVRREHGAERLLTEKQRELLMTAVERGYYETPRRCTLTELADHVGLAKSTCSETLHRVEETVVSYFVSNAVTTRNTEPREPEAERARERGEEPERVRA